MRTRTSIAGLLSALIVLTGCAGAGRDFIRPDADTFKLGQTTYSQVVQRMGEPKTVSDVVQNGKQVKSVVYSYANVSGQPLEDGVIPYRGMTYSFYNDTLVGEQFMSSFKSDNSNFEEKLVDRIQKGQTRRAEVIQLLGPPTASFIVPMVKETSDEAIGYTYQAIRGGLFSGLKVYAKALRVSFDRSGVVTEVEYSSQGTK